MKLVRSSKAVILDKNNQALMLYRSASHPRQPLEPDLPGGITEADETIEDGLVREILEETGIIVERTALKLLFTFTQDFPGVSVNRLLYAVKLVENAPEIKISYEHSKYEWVKISDLKEVELPYQKGIDYANNHQLWATL